MRTGLKKQEKGFTIVEVMIVLGIAGLILLIVFLAVPALQRNQRNTARKNDVSRVGAAVNEFISNNNGTTPSTPGHVTTITNSVGSMSQYDATGVSISVGGTPAAIGDVTQMRIVTQRKCAADGAVTGANATSRNVAIQYASESGSGTPTPLCIDI